MKTLSLKLPEELDARLGAMARQTRSTKSEVVRSALEAYLGAEAGLHKGSVLDLAPHLIGSLEGPSDLSYHKDHMHGYGE
jgi:Arc/MetJ-type ribon-helix-helix transcriptional regulator